jgi:hypothetical protein
MSYKLKELKPAKDNKHKYVATLENKDTGREKNIKFGAFGMSDYTKHKDDDRKMRYEKRHKGMGEDWTDPSTKGFWSKNILWNKKTIKASLEDTKKKFKL